MKELQFVLSNAELSEVLLLLVAILNMDQSIERLTAGRRDAQKNTKQTTQSCTFGNYVESFNGICTELT